jgi:RNA polymerase sigma factor (sigma-70 family)
MIVYDNHMVKTSVKPRISVKRTVKEPLSLLQRIGAGDTSAMLACMERFRGLVWSLVRRSCSNAADAEDIVQEIFISVWRSAHRFDPTIASESTFVSVIARRRLIDRTRQRMRRPTPGPIIQDVEFDHVELPRCEIKEAGAIAQAALLDLKVFMVQKSQVTPAQEGGNQDYPFFHLPLLASTLLPFLSMKYQLSLTHVVCSPSD